MPNVPCVHVFLFLFREKDAYQAESLLTSNTGGGEERRGRKETCLFCSKITVSITVLAIHNFAIWAAVIQ